MKKSTLISDLVYEVDGLHDLRYLCRVVGLRVERVGKTKLTLIWDNGRTCASAVDFDAAVAVLHSLLSEN